MSKMSQEIAESYRGAWCDESLAMLKDEHGDDAAGLEYYGGFLRELWASALVKGDLKSAHKLWGKWQSVIGRDPWEDEGWRNFWELQRFGEKLWDDFNAAQDQDRVLLQTFLSYWPEAEID